MQLHLDEIATQVAPGAHALVLLDQAGWLDQPGWHTTGKLRVPDNMTLLALPSKASELNPVENVWQFLREKWLYNRVFKSDEEIIALSCDAWNNLIDRPWTIMSIVLRAWAHRF